MKQHDHMAMARPLTVKQQRFVAEYLLDSNGTQAAIRAGYSRRSAKQQASVLLTKHDIKQAIAARLQEADLTAARTLEELRRAPFASAMRRPVPVSPCC